MSVYVISQPDHDNENIDSVWHKEEDALVRAAQLGRPFIVEYRVDQPNGWVRSGWFHPDGPQCWSDWGSKERV